MAKRALEVYRACDASVPPVRALCVTDVSASSDCDSLARVGGRVPRPPLYILNYFNMLDAPRWLALSPLAGHCIELRQRHHMQATL